MAKNTQKTEKYTEILILAEMLENAQIPFFMFNNFGGYQICYCAGHRLDDKIFCSAIEFKGSYGAEEDLIEIMGLLTPEEEECDSVLGYLTAENVFDRIYKHWNSTP